MSSSEASLLRAVVEELDSDEPRWAYARYAETRGDPRAELIRAQMTVAAYQRTHDSPTKWAAHAKRASELIAKHRPLWQQPLETLVGDGAISDLRFHRGFIEHIAVPARRFSALAKQAYALAPIRHLTLIDVAEHPDVLASPELARIVSLAFTGSRVDDRAIQILAGSVHSRRLHWLDLLAHDITLSGVQALCASPHLRALQYVNLTGTKVEDPIEQYWLDGETITHTTDTELGKELEQKFGPQVWLHAPSRFGAAYPPLYEATVDP
ncbi:MAG: TIGR02996 domain-containing protein [Kofleriaceae bacterium]